MCSSDLSSEMRGLYSDKGWTDFMGAVFALLHQEGTSQSSILELMAGLELSPNMQGLLEEAVDRLAATVIIISDSNSEFIREILRVRGLEDRVDRVFTNPATWRQDGLLEMLFTKYTLLPIQRFLIFASVISRLSNKPIQPQLPLPLRLPPWPVVYLVHRLLGA